MIKVLYIEDSESIMVSLGTRLLRYVFENVAWVQGGVAAISKIQEWQPSLVVIGASSMQTEELMEQFHSVYSGISIGIIRHEVEKSKLRCDFYIYKPINADKFWPFLEELAGKLTDNNSGELRIWLSEKQREFVEVK